MVVGGEPRPRGEPTLKSSVVVGGEPRPRGEPTAELVAGGEPRSRGEPTAELIGSDARGAGSLLVVCGPTGVGKTAAAVALAARLPVEVVSADSRQVYRMMDAATGKPTADERSAVVHHLIDIVDPDDRYNAARFRRDAATAIESIQARGRFPVVVGGTGLYIRALLRGLDPAPPADPALRRELETVAAMHGPAALHERLRQAAPEMARRLHPNDSVRVVRALERVRSGNPATAEPGRWRAGLSDYRTVQIGLTMDRASLFRRLRARARAMAAAGLLEEVLALLAQGYDPSLPAMRGIGYREFVDVARGALDRDEAVRRMERETLQYARRQWTWFAREPGLRWIDVGVVGGPEAVAVEIHRIAAEEGLIE
jgi:tRNA dimethylallyltransferase